MDDELRPQWEASRAAWPGIAVDYDAFAAYVRARAPKTEGGRTFPSDLYLACACARGDAGALAAFEAAFFPQLPVTLRAAKISAVAVDDLEQALRARLFVAPPDGAPKITEYSGRGELRTWFRIVATRTALNLVRGPGRREVALDDRALPLLLGTGDDPELAYFKRLYTSEFRAAFAEALEALEPRDRSLLRYAFVDGLGTEAIGAVYAVHRATAGRWLAKAHEDLTKHLKNALKARLGANGRDYASVLRLIESQMTITLERYLKE